MTAAAQALWIKQPLAVFGPAAASGGLVVRDSVIVELVPAGAPPGTRDCAIPAPAIRWRPWCSAAAPKPTG